METDDFCVDGSNIVDTPNKTFTTLEYILYIVLYYPNYIDCMFIKHNISIAKSRCLTG